MACGPARAMIPLPFTLTIKSRDYSTAEFTAWSTEQVHGLLHFDGALLGVEWAGTSSIDEVDGLTVQSETVVLTPEYHSIPLHRLRSARLTGGWWRVRIELSSNDLVAFAPIPGASAGRIAFRIARRDRVRAAQFVAALQETALRLRSGDAAGPKAGAGSSDLA